MEIMQLILTLIMGLGVQEHTGEEMEGMGVFWEHPEQGQNPLIRPISQGVVQAVWGLSMQVF
jgi:hypothetical protein